MSQHDYSIANQSGAAFRSDLNNALAAIVSQNSGATEPATTYAYQFWADTTTATLKLRNSANSAWIELMQLDGTLTMEDGTEALPGLSFRNDLDTGLWRPGDNQLAISTNAVERVEFGASEVVFNDGGANYDFRVEGDTNANLLFVDASADAVGIGTSSPSGNLHVYNPATTSADIYLENTDGYYNLKLNNQNFDIFESATSRVRIASGGNVGIGTTSVNAKLEISGNSGGRGLRLSEPSGEELDISAGAAANDPARIATSAGSGIAFAVNGTAGENARIDSSGRLLVGTSTSISTANGFTPSVQVAGTSTLAAISAGRYAANANPAQVVLQKSRNATIGSHTVVASGDEVGSVSFEGSDGTSFIQAALITAAVDGTPGTNDMPGRLVFSTTADGASSPTRRMTIKQDGSFVFGNFDAVGSTATGGKAYIESNSTLYVAVGGGTVAYFNRNTDDGEIVALRQANVTEGSISVSGTTVTYGGGHLARWSQLSNNEDPSSILKGTVMSNLDEMCEWGDEDNEQLNKTKISDVEGDPNVAGVFVATSFDEEGPLDFFVGMTGDMVIRIASGVSVQRGDLLMSAGDGTAKPQDDDIIRSKTIAKVTSTNVSCTYDDGSYCVPCVLMAC